MFDILYGLYKYRFYRFQCDYHYNLTFDIVGEFDENLVFDNIKELTHFRTLEPETEWFMKLDDIKLINNEKE